MKNIKILLTLSLIGGLFTININNTEIKAEESTSSDAVVENTTSTEEKVEESVIEEDITKYNYDEQGNIISEVSEEETDAPKDDSPIAKSARAYSVGYIDFIGYSSQVISVYQTSTSTTPYTYFNTGSGERIASLGEANGRIKIAINGFVGFIDKTAYVVSAPFRPAATLGADYSEYYTVNQYGDLVYTYCYYETLTNIVVGKAPDFFQNGVKYYSLDGIYFYTNRTQMLNEYSVGTAAGSMNVSNPFFNYYQYLPFRSKTNLNANDFKKFLLSRTNTSSVMNNDTVIYQFFDSENNLGVNAALEFSMAMLESGYGTSQIAREKNNLFGWGAVDSGPYAGAFKFGSVAQGVNYHFKNAVSSGYLDVVDDFRYYGGSVGNKNTGLNVKYASDPYWGMKIAGIYYSMDKQSGYKDYNFYKLAIQTSPGSQVTYNGAHAYYAKNMTSNFNVTNLPFLVVGDNASTVSIMSDIGVCNSGDSITNLNINQSTLQLYTTNYNCPSTKVHFGAQYKFNEDIVQIPKSSVIYTGGNTINRPGNGFYEEVGEEVVVGDITYVLKRDSDLVLYAYKKDAQSNRTTYLEYYPGTKVATGPSNVMYQFNVNPANGYIINAIGYSQGSTTPINYYEYAAGTIYSRSGSHGANTKYVFYMNGLAIDKTYGYTNGKVTEVYEYAPNTQYSSSGSHSVNTTNVYSVDSKSMLTSAVSYDKGKKVAFLEFFPNTSYTNRTNIQTKFFVEESNVIKYAQGYEKGSTTPAYYYEYKSGTKYSKTGSHGAGTATIFYMKDNYIEKAYGYTNLSVTNIYEYEKNTPYSTTGAHGAKTKFIYNVDSKLVITNAVEYSAGKKVAYVELYPNSKFDTRTNVRYKFYVNDNDTIKYAQGYDKGSSTVTNYYEYAPGTKYSKSGSHGASTQYVFYMKNNYIEKAYGYANQRIVNVYEYNTNTAYGLNGEHGSKVKYVYDIDKLNNLSLGKEYSNGKLVSYMEYYPGTNYENKSKILNKFHIDASGYIKYAEGYNTSGKVVNYYEYHKNTKFGTHSSKIRYVFYNSPYTGELIVAYEVDSNWKNKIEYKYYPNTVYDPNGSHGSQVFSVRPL